MKFKRWALVSLLTAGLLLGTLPQAPSAWAATPLAVSTKGSTVTATGTYEDENGEALGGLPVILHVVNSGGAKIIHADQTTTDALGRYEFAWTMPSTAPSGTYSVQVNLRGQWVLSTFTHTSSAVVSNTVSLVNLSPYRFTGELNNGSRQAVVYNTDTGLNLAQSNGRSTVTLNSDRAKSVVRNAPQGTQYLTISIPTRDPQAQVTVPRDVIQQMITSWGMNARLLIAAEAGSYDLPLQAVNPYLLESVRGAADGSLLFKIDRIQSSLSIDLSNRIYQLQAKPLGLPVEFAVHAQFGGQSIPLQDYGRSFVRYSIDLGGQTIDAAKKQSALFRHPATGQLIAAPTKLYRDALGHGKIVITRTGNGIYTPLEAQRNFSDIFPYGDADKEKIESLASKYVILGRSEQQFDPFGQISRAEFATLLVRALGLADKQGTTRFTDVNGGEWYSDPVGIGATLGLINGYSERSFGPFDPITREQMIVLLSRALNYVETRPYVDTTRLLGPIIDHRELADWSREDVALALQTGILESDTSWLYPKRNATRSEAAEMLYNLLKHLQML